MNTELKSISAIVRDERTGDWVQYTHALELISANSLDQVESAFERIQQSVDAGRTAVGFVSYEAAPAFDPSLPVHNAAGSLLCFAIFDSFHSISLPAGTQGLATNLRPTLSRANYLRAITQIKKHLEAGDSYQVNYTHQLAEKVSSDSIDSQEIFFTLYEQQPSPRSIYFQTDQLTLCSVSPELFFQLDGERISMEPMKGTRPRHSDPRIDRALREELLLSEKEKAENLMIVDMVRNDLGKIASPGSVNVDALFEIMALPSLWQQISRVSAITHASLWEIFKALFPCASITGAPKRQSMEIIKQLENQIRGAYTGAIGIVRHDGSAQFNVGIRTLVCDNLRNTLSYGVGSGIVWDSEWESEWQESMDKARILQSLQKFELLETMVYHPEKGIYLQDFHLQRLQRSAEFFAFTFDWQQIAVSLNGIEENQSMRVRLLLAMNGEFRVELAELSPQISTVCLALALESVSSENVFLHHKTTNRSVYELAKEAIPNVDDVILWNERNEITETTIYNLFLEIEGELLTPCLSSGLLPGTLRRQLLESGQAKEAVLNKADLQRATQLFVGNSVRGLIAATLKS